MRTHRLKRTRALIPAAIAAAVLLAGCTAGTDLPNTPDPGSNPAAGECATSGEASAAVTVEGERGGEVTLTTTTPISTDKLERSVLTEGDGTRIPEGESLIASITIFNGRTGEVLQRSQPAPIENDASRLSDWAAELVQCGEPGQRVVLALPAEDVLNGPASEAGIDGLQDGDTLVIVSDITQGYIDSGDLLKKAEGTAQSLDTAFPTVKLDTDGAPTITVPTGVDQPTALQVGTLIEGDGETVEAGDRVYVNYRGIIWRTGEEFDSSWSRGAPTDFLTTQVIGGFSKALVGQKVGSQIISVVPAEDGGYGAAQLQSMGHQPDDVMVFVLDILGTLHAK